MWKTSEILNVLNLPYKMEYLLRVDDASEPDWAVIKLMKDILFRPDMPYN